MQKADIISYGMGENSMLELAKKIKNNEDWRDIRGLCYIAKEPKADYIEILAMKTVLRTRKNL